MATLNNAITRMGITGPAKNYTRPFTVKAETDAALKSPRVFVNTAVGQMMGG